MEKNTNQCSMASKWGIILFTFYINPWSYRLNIDCNCNWFGRLLVLWVGCWGLFSFLNVEKEHFCSIILWTAEIWINKQYNWIEKIKQKTPSVYVHMILSSKEGGRNECVSYVLVLKESIFWLSLLLIAVKQQFSYTDFSCNVLQNCTP